MDTVYGGEMFLSTQAFILTAEARTKPQCRIALFCASPGGTLEITVPFKPYFFVERAPGEDEGEAFTSLSGVRAKRVEFDSIEEADEARDAFSRRGIRTFEADVRARERFLMDRRLYGAITVKGDGERRGSLWRLNDPVIEPSDYTPSFRICSLDIETSVTSNSLLSIGVHLTGSGLDERRVFMRGQCGKSPEDTVTFHGDERNLIRTFAGWFSDRDPDLIIGWNVVRFDLTFLFQRARALDMKLRLGRMERPSSVTEGKTGFSRAIVPGRIVLDGPQLLRASFYTFESYSLEHVAQRVLGEGKLISPGADRAWEIERLYQEDPHALAKYNLKDCLLVTKIFSTSGLIDLTVKRTRLSGMLLDQVGMSTASLDHYMLPRLHERKFAAPNVGDVGEVRAAAGGYVIHPAAGLYEDVIVLDFQSLYPSIIRTFCIDPLSCAEHAIDPLVTPTGHVFSRSRHLLPAFIEFLMNERARAREEKNTTLAQAVKILMNSFYGVMGSAGSRLYHPSLADAITGTGQWLFTESRKWIEEQGHEVLYGDTDSLFVRAGTDVSDVPAFGMAMGEALTEQWRKRLRNEFQIESQLQLDYRKHYKRFLIPAARGGIEWGAKKRYAGLVEKEDGDEVEFTGLEVVRSDWTSLAREFQVDLYTRIFRNEPVDEFIRNFVARVREGAFDDKLVYRKRLHKPPEEYGPSPPPYVRAALMLKKRIREVRYVMTLKGPVPVEHNPVSPDYEHYISRQIQPVADSILEVIGTSFDAITRPSQLKLL